MERSYLSQSDVGDNIMLATLWIITLVTVLGSW